MHPVSINRREFLLASTAASGLLLGGRRQMPSQPEFHICPKSRPPAKILFATRLAELTSYGWDMRLTLSCLEGIVNRPQPRLFLIHDRYDELWLEWLREREDVERVEWLEVAQVFERFLPEVACMFVTDPAIPASINVATMLASVHGGLVATPATAGQYNLSMGQAPDSSKNGLDLREMHWKKDVEAYRWAFEQFGDQLSRQAIAVLDPQEPAPRDYLVEFKIPILWMSGTSDVPNNPQASPEEEKQFARDIMMKWPPNIPCFGWPGTGPQTPGIGESEGVHVASDCAKFWVCTAYDGYSPSVGNASVHSGTAASLRQPVPPIRLQRDKVYLAFIRTDGDGMNFIRHYYRFLSDDPGHGGTPMGWQIGPASSDLIPDILDYYYKHARPGDCFVNALTGPGYIHEDRYAQNYPAEQRRQILEDYLRLAAAYRQRIDASVMCTYSEMSKDLLESFAGSTGVTSLFANYARSHATTLENVVTEAAGRPVFRSVNGSAFWLFANLSYTPEARRNTEFHMVNEIKRWTPHQRPAFLYVSLANWLRRMEMATNIVKGLGMDYMVVRPDQLVSLYHQSQNR